MLRGVGEPSRSRDARRFWVSCEVRGPRRDKRTLVSREVTEPRVSSEVRDTRMICDIRESKVSRDGRKHMVSHGTNELV